MSPACRRVGLALLALLVVSSGVGAEEVRDMLGRRVSVAATPTRIVSLAPSMTEIVYALGAGDRLLGVTDYCDFPQAASRKTKVGGIYTPNFELILNLNPDLVLSTSEGNREEHIRALDRLRIPVYVVRPLDFVTVLESIERVGRLLGKEPEAARVVAAMRDGAAEVARATGEMPRPRVLYVLWGNPLIVPGRQTLATDLIRRAGGVSVTGEESSPYPRFSVEAAVAADPEQVIVAQHGAGAVADRLREWPYLTLLPAVRRGRIDVIDDDLVHRPGPRIVEGLRTLARLLHPGRVR